MNVIFTCGGTAGHVNPALALAGYMQERHPDLRVLFVGTPRGMERGLIEKAGYDFRSIEVSSFQRSLSPSGIAHNVKSLKNLALAGSRARAILRDFRPDLVVGTGGYASYPMVKYAAKEGIPTAVHESNMVPGLTTKMLEGYAGCIMVGFEECRQHYKHPEKIVVTGTPVRGDFFRQTREQARQKLGLTDDRPLAVSFWGSLGARFMNEHMLDFFRLEARDGMPFHHIHAAGLHQVGNALIAGHAPLGGPLPPGGGGVYHARHGAAVQVEIVAVVHGAHAARAHDSDVDHGRHLTGRSRGL